MAGKAQPVHEDPLTMQIAAWVAATSASDLPDTVRHQVKRIVLDYLSAAVLGSDAESARIVRDYIRRTDRDTSATVIATDVRLSPAGAALVNGTASHALDVDDGYTPGGFHPSGPVVSAVFAAAEAAGSDADAVMRAIALGYEVACRIAGATHPRQRERNFHNTPLAGVMGASVAVAALHGLDAEGIAGALGNAGSHASGLNAYLDQGSEIKRLHAGKAARDGLISAELSAAGLRGPLIILEAPRGYLAAFTGGDYRHDHLMDGLGTTWRMLRTYNKPYPCCRHVHGAVDAALMIREREGLSAADITSVTVDTFAIAASHDDQIIHNLLDAQMSLPYSVAAGLTYGEVGMGQFGDQARAHEQVQRLTGAVEVTVDDAYTSDYPNSRAARVTIRTADREFVEEVLQPYGEPDNPMPDADLEAKLMRLAGPIVGDDRAQVMVDATWAFDDPARIFKAMAG